MIKAEVIADSITPWGDRLVTLEATYPRFIHPEAMTYRQWSRSSASSRAIGVMRRVKELRAGYIAYPVEWGKNEVGMVASELLGESNREKCEARWKEMALASADMAEELHKLGVHKQLANRPMEPYLWHTMVISSTDFKHMFRQRIHKDAQPEFRELAICMKQAVIDSTPRLIDMGQWHLPYVTDEERAAQDQATQMKISVARVARTSYLNQGKVDIQDDLKLFDRFLLPPSSDDPEHAAPFEMVATPSPTLTKGNFQGYSQWRHIVFPES